MAAPHSADADAALLDHVPDLAQRAVIGICLDGTGSALQGEVQEEITMPQSRKSARSRKAPRAPSRRNGQGSDAISLLKADHNEVKKWFGEFEKTRSDSRKQQLAQQICTALKAHTTIEEEIFYPAFLEATDDKDIHHEAEVEHEGAKKLIEEIEAAGPDDDYFDARISVLSEMIKHHVNEEEKRGGMFAKARGSDMDLEALGEQLRQRKQELMGEESSMSGERDADTTDRRGRGGVGGLFGRNGKGRDARNRAS
jgi:hemerythrin superfamily protein